MPLKVQDQFREHLHSVFDDRGVDARVNEISKQTLRTKTALECILSMSFDGMDQCKFKLPRNVDNNKDSGGQRGWENVRGKGGRCQLATEGRCQGGRVRARQAGDPGGKVCRMQAREGPQLQGARMAGQGQMQRLQHRLGQQMVLPSPWGLRGGWPRHDLDSAW